MLVRGEKQVVSTLGSGSEARIWLDGPSIAQNPDAMHSGTCHLVPDFRLAPDVSPFWRLPLLLCSRDISCPILMKALSPLGSDFNYFFLDIGRLRTTQGNIRQEN